MLCAWSHLDVSRWLYEQGLEGDQTRLGSVTGLSAGLLASTRCSHLTGMSKWDRSSLREGDPGQGKPPPGERYKGTHGGGVYLWGEVYQTGRLMGSITGDHTGKVSPPWGAVLPSHLKAECEGKKAQGSLRGWGLGGSRREDSTDHSTEALQHLQG